MSNSNPTQNTLWGDQKQDGFDLKEFLFSYLLRYWYLYVFFLGSAFFLAWVKIRYSTPIYQQRSTLLIKDERSGSSGVSQEDIFKDLGLMQGGPRIENEIQILKSRPIMEEVVRQLGLDVEYYNIGRVRTSELYTGSPIKAALHDLNENGYGVHFQISIQDTQTYKLRIGNQSSVHQFGERLDLPYGKLIFTLQTKEIPSVNAFDVVFREPKDAAAGYVGSLGVSSVDNRSSVLELTFRSPTPQKGIDILDKIVTVYNETNIEDKNSVGKNTIQFIDDRLKYLTRELSDVEGNLEQYKKSNDIPTEIASNVETLISQVQEYDKEQTMLEVQNSILESLTDYLQNRLTQFEPAPVNLIPENTQIAVLVGRYNDLVFERTRMLRNATTENPVVQNLSAQINTMRSSILETLKNTRGDLNLSLNKVRNKNSIFQQKIRTIPTKERGLLEIKRQQGIKETLFLYLLQKREETALSLATVVPNSRVVNPAINTGGPISPNGRSIYATFLLIGLLIPSLYVYLKHLLTTTVQSESDVRNHTSVPMLGAVAFKKGDEQVVVKPHSRSAMAEMFRLLRTNLQFLAAGEANQVILITSSISGEGKSFISLNMGMTLALADKKTVIVELDLRKPKLIRYLTSHPAEVGITSYLIGQTLEQDIIRPSEIHPNLFYVGSGPIPPNPAELLLTDKLQQFIQDLRNQFDYVIIDTPPVGMVADALLLGPLADCSLYIVRHGYSSISNLEILEDIRRENKLPKPAIVFNGVKMGNSYGGAYGSRYGYGYGYGYGEGYGYYDDDVKKKPWWKFWGKK